MDVNTRRLRHFVTLAETLHFTRAAELLYVSQQGLSRSIADLEKEIGTTLLERSTRSVILTDAGKEFLDAARRVLAELDAGAEAVRRLQERRADVLHLGVGVAAAPELLHRIVQAFRARYPAVTLELEEYGWGNPSCGLRSGETDIACARVPIDIADLHTDTLLVEPRVIGVASTHPLAASGPARLSDLRGQVVLAPRTDDANWRSFWTLRDTGLDPELLPRVATATSSLEEEVETVESGAAIAVTVMSVARLSPSAAIVYRPIEDVPGARLVLGWRGRGTPLTEKFRAVAAEVLEREADLVSRIMDGNENP